MSTRSRLQDAHNALGDIYRRAPFVSVDTKQTRDLWAEIERLEAEIG